MPYNPQFYIGVKKFANMSGGNQVKFDLADERIRITRLKIKFTLKDKATNRHKNSFVRRAMSKINMGA